MVLDVPLCQAASPVCHPPLQRRTILLLTVATEQGLSQTLGYSRCHSWSGCRAEPRLALGRILIMSGSVTPHGFPWWQWCLGTFPAPLLPQAVQAAASSATEHKCGPGHVP